MFFHILCTCHNKLHIHLLRVQICNVDVVVVVVVFIVIVVPVVVVAVGVVDNVHGRIDHGQDEADKSDGGKLGKQALNPHLETKVIGASVRGNQTRRKQMYMYNVFSKEQRDRRERSTI